MLILFFSVIPVSLCIPVCAKEQHPAMLFLTSVNILRMYLQYILLTHCFQCPHIPPLPWATAFFQLTSSEFYAFDIVSLPLVSFTPSFELPVPPGRPPASVHFSNDIKCNSCLLHVLHGALSQLWWITLKRKDM